MTNAIYARWAVWVSAFLMRLVVVREVFASAQDQAESAGRAMNFHHASSPLSHEPLRPGRLSEVIGQKCLLGPGMPLRLAFESGRPHQKTDGLLLRESTLPPVCPVPRRSAGGRSGLGHEREVCWPTDGVDREVNVQRWPIEVVWGGVLDCGDLVHGGLLEPGELFEGEV